MADKILNALAILTGCAIVVFLLACITARNSNPAQFTLEALLNGLPRL